MSTKGKNRREWCEITGYDGSEAQLQAIRNLASLPIDFTWSMVITPENVQSLCESVQIAHDNGEKQFSFTFIIDNDDAKEKDLAYLQKHDPIKLVSDFISQIDKLSAITDDWWVEYSFPMCMYTEEQLKLLKGRLATPCQIHLKNAVTFNTKMELLPCDMYIYQRLGKFGRDFSSYQGFLSLTESANYSKTMDEIRRLPSDECTTCEHFGVCEEQVVKMSSGVVLDDGVKTQPAVIHVVVDEPGRTVLAITLHEGRNRQTRRMCEAVGLEVIRLKRSAEGPVKLGMLQPGEYRELKKSEISALRNAALKAAPARKAAPAAARRPGPIKHD